MSKSSAGVIHEVVMRTLDVVGTPARFKVSAKWSQNSSSHSPSGLLPVNGPDSYVIVGLAVDSVPLAGSAACAAMLPKQHSAASMRRRGVDILGSPVQTDRAPRP